MTDEFKPFLCHECGGTVRMLHPDGDTWEFRRGIRVVIPREVLIPKCDKCGETYFGERDDARVTAAVRKVFLAEQQAVYERCVGALQREHGATLREIEEVCGVTPTYFSHVMKGRRIASLTLTRLLEAFVAAPGEFERHREAARRSKLQGRVAVAQARVAWKSATVLPGRGVRARAAAPPAHMGVSA